MNTNDRNTATTVHGASTASRLSPRMSPRRRRRERVRKAFAWLVISAFSFSSSPWVYAGPEGGNVIRGQGNIERPDLDTTVINQFSDRMVVDWDSFDVGANEMVRFIQPGMDSAALNRIFDQMPSEIFGTIEANGQLFLINPNGIVFGETAVVDVAGLMASTLQISPEEFMAGEWTFNLGDSEGKVVNQGTLQASPGGFITLAGAGVSNEGLIVADFAQVTLASGKQVIIDFDGSGAMRFTVDGATVANGDDGEAQVDNSGTIQADGGQVLLTASVVDSILDQAINTSGVITAQSLEGSEGSIRLIGTGGDVVADGGVLDASSPDGQGGTVEMTGERVGLFGDSVVDVSGETGGGTAHIGGEYQGGTGAPGELATATQTIVGSDAVIDASAGTSGDGGEVIVWADEYANVGGTISATGGAESGDGGFIETSSAGRIDVFGGIYDVGAPNGTGGEWLIDPTDIAISDYDDSDISGSPTFSDATDNGGISNLNTGTLETALNSGGTITVTTNTASGTGSHSGGGNIYIVDPVDFSGGSNATLALIAANSIFFSNQDPGTFTGATFTGSDDATNAGQISDAAGGGALSLDFDAGSSIDMFAATTTPVQVEGNIDWSAGSQVTIADTVTAGGSIDIATTGGSRLVQFSENSTISAQGGDLSVTGFNTFLVNGAGLAVTLQASNDLNLTGTGSTAAIRSDDTGSSLTLQGDYDFTGGDAIGDGVGNVNITGSVDLANGADASNGISITGTDVTFVSSSIQTSDTGSIGAVDIDAQGSVDLGNMSQSGGSLGDFTVDFNGTLDLSGTSFTSTAAGTQLFTGTGTGDTIIGPNSGTTFSIGGTLDDTASEDGVDDGHVISTLFEFENVENLNGGTGDDVFTIVSGGSVSGSIAGGGQTAGDSLTYDDDGNTITITGTGAGNSTDASFTGIEAVAGGAAADTFEFDSIATIDVDGAGGADVFNLDSVIVGDVAGGAGGDTFNMLDGGDVSGTIDGGAGADSLDYSAATGPISVTVADIGTTDGFKGDETGLTGTFDNMDALVGTANTGDELTGYNVGGSAFWTIDGADSGNYMVNFGGGRTLDFSSIENLTGGAQINDEFTLTGGGTLSGAIDGGLSNGGVEITLDDVANQVNITGDGTSQGVTGTATGIGGGFDNTTGVTGGSMADTFDLDADTTGGVDLLGGGGVDTFNIDQAMVGDVEGGAGNDVVNITAILDGAVYGDAGDDTFNVDGTASTAGVIGGYIYGGDSDNTFNDADTLNIQGTVDLGGDGFLGESGSDTLVFVGDVNMVDTFSGWSDNEFDVETVDNSTNSVLADASGSTDTIYFRDVVNFGTAANPVLTDVYSLSITSGNSGADAADVYLTQVDGFYDDLDGLNVDAGGATGGSTVVADIAVGGIVSGSIAAQTFTATAETGIDIGSGTSNIGTLDVSTTSGDIYVPNGSDSNEALTVRNASTGSGNIDIFNDGGATGGDIIVDDGSGTNNDGVAIFTGDGYVFLYNQWNDTANGIIVNDAIEANGTDGGAGNRGIYVWTEDDVNVNADLISQDLVEIVAAIGGAGGTGGLNMAAGTSITAAEAIQIQTVGDVNIETLNTTDTDGSNTYFGNTESVLIDSSTGAITGNTGVTTHITAGGSLDLDSSGNITGVDGTLSTDAASLTANTDGGGNINITNATGLTLGGGALTTTGAGTVDLTVTTGDIALSNATTEVTSGSGDITLEATAGSILDGEGDDGAPNTDISTSGAISLTAGGTGGSIGTSADNIEIANASSLTMSSNGGGSFVDGDGTVALTSADFSSSGDEDVQYSDGTVTIDVTGDGSGNTVVNHIDGGASLETVTFDVTSGDVLIDDFGDTFGIGNLTGANTVSITTPGAIDTVTTGGTHIAADVINLNSATGIGASGTLQTTNGGSGTTTMTVNNSTSGNIDIFNVGTLDLAGGSNSGGGSTQIVAGSPFTLSSDFDGGGGDVVLAADFDGGTDDDLTLNADVINAANVELWGGNAVIMATNSDVTGTGDVAVYAGSDFSASSTDGGSDDDTADISMGDGSTITAGGNVVMRSPSDIALSSVSATGTATLDAGLGAGTAGVITDNLTGEGAGFENVTGTTVSLDAEAGIGDADDIDIDADLLQLGLSVSGSANITDSDDLTLNDIGLNGAAAAHTFTANGTLTVDDSLAPGNNDNLALVGSATTLTFNALGSNSDIVMTDGLTITSGAVNLNADDSVTFGATGFINTDGAVTIAANADATADGDSGDVITMADGATINAGTGVIDMDADGDITLGGLTTTGASVDINSANGNIVDGGDTDLDIDASAANVNLVATDIGNDGAGGLETTIAGLSATSVNGIMEITETDDLNINGINVGTGGTLTITSTGGGIVDGVGGLDITAGDLILSADTGIGAADPIDTEAVTLNATTNTGGIQVWENTTLTVENATINTSGNLEILNFAGDLIVDDGSGTDNDGTAINVTGGGTIDLEAGNGRTDDTSSLIINDDITGSGGAMTLTADRDVFVDADVTSGGGNISITADPTDDGADQVGGYGQSADTSVDAGAGTLSITSTGGQTLGNLASTNAGTAITLTSTRSGVVGQAATAEHVTAASGELTIDVGTVSGLGDIGSSTTPILTQVGTLDVLASAGSVYIEELDAVDVSQLESNGLETVSLVAGGDISLVNTGATDVNSNGGDIFLESTGGSIDDSVDAASEVVADISTSGQINLTALGDIGTSTTDRIALSGSNDLVITNQGNVFLNTDTALADFEASYDGSDNDTFDLSGSTVVDVIEDGAGTVNINAINSSGADMNIDLTVLGDAAIASGALATDGIDAGTGGVVNLDATGAVSDSSASAGINIRAADLIIESTGGIGPVDAFDTQVNNIAIQNDGGGNVDIFNIANTATFTITELNPLDGGLAVTGANNAGGGQMQIRAASPLTVDSDVVNAGGGNIILAATGTIAADDVDLNADVLATGGNGNISIYAGDSIDFQGTTGVDGEGGEAVVSAAGTGTVLIASDTDFASGSETNGSGGGTIVMRDGSIAESQDGDITLRSSGDVALSIVDADSNDDGTAGNVTVTADFDGPGGGLSNNDGGVIDNLGGDSTANPNISGAALTVSAATGIESAGEDPIETAVDSVVATNTTSGDIRFFDADDITVGDITNSAAGARVRIDTTNGTITLDDSTLGDNSGTAITADGDIGLFANGTDSDITLTDGISLTGELNMIAEDSIFASADGDITATGTGFISATASGDVAVTGDDGEVIDMTDGALWDAGSGTIDLTADGDITLGALTTTDASVPSVTITSTTGGIAEDSNTGIEITTAGRIVIDTVTGVSTQANAIEIESGSLDVDNTTSGEIGISEVTGDLNLVNLTHAGTGQSTINTLAGSINIDDSAADNNGTAVNSTSTGLMTFNADGANSDININDAVNNGGAISFLADDSVIAGADGDVTGSGTLTVTANADTVAGGDSGEVITMADGAIFDATAGNIDMDAVGDITLGSIQTTDSTTAAISLVSTTGGIVDGGDTDVDVVAEDGLLAMSAVTGIGASGAAADTDLETSVGSIQATTSGATGGIRIDETTGFWIYAAEVTNAANADAIDISTGGNLQVNDGGLLGGGVRVSHAGTAGGDVILTAAGAPTSDIELVRAIETASGNVILSANDSVSAVSATSTATGNITANGAGSIIVTSNSDANVAGGDSGEQIQMADGVLWDGGSGTVTLSAGGDVTLGGLTTTSATGAGDISVTSTAGSIVDGGGAHVDAVAVNGQLVLDAAVNAGVADDDELNPDSALETTVANLDATTGNDLHIDELDSIVLDGLSVGGNSDISPAACCNGDITDNTNVTLTVVGEADFNTVNGDVILGDDAGDTVNFGSFEAVAQNVSLFENSGTNFIGTTDVAVNMDITSDGDITDDANASIDVGADATLAVVDTTAGTGQDIVLGDTTTDHVAFGRLNVTADSVQITEEDSGIEFFGVNNVSTDLSAIAAGPITDSNATTLSVGDNAFFDTGLATFGTDLVTLGDDDVADTTNFGNLTVVGSDVTINEDSATVFEDSDLDGTTSLVSGNLDLTADGTITDTDNDSTLVVTGTTDLDTDAVTSEIRLDNANNDFGGVVTFNSVVGSIDDATFTDANEITFGNGTDDLTINNQLSVHAGGLVTQTAGTNLIGNFTLGVIETGSGGVDFGEAGNDFNLVAISTNGAVDLDDVNDITVGRIVDPTGVTVDGTHFGTGNVAATDLVGIADGLVTGTAGVDIDAPNGSILITENVRADGTDDINLTALTEIRVQTLPGDGTTVTTFDGDINVNVTDGILVLEDEADPVIGSLVASGVGNIDVVVNDIEIQENDADGNYQIVAGGDIDIRPNTGLTMAMGDDAVADATGSTFDMKIDDSEMDEISSNTVLTFGDATTGNVLLDRAAVYTESTLNLITSGTVDDVNVGLALDNGATTNGLNITAGGEIGSGSAAPLYVDVDSVVVNSSGGQDVSIQNVALDNDSNWSVTTGGAGTGDIFLVQENNDFVLSDLATTDNLYIEATLGSVTDTIPTGTTIEVGGNAEFVAGTEVIIGDIDGLDVTNFGSLTVTAGTDANINEDSATTLSAGFFNPPGTTTAVDVGGNFTLVSDGAVDQTAQILVTGETDVDSVTDEGITFDDITNDFVGQVSLDGADVEVQDANDLILGDINADDNAFGTGAFTAQTQNGTITDGFEVVMDTDGITTLTAGGPSDILLGNDAADNLKFGVLVVDGANVSITENEAMVIDHLVATGDATLTANGSITDEAIATTTEVQVTGTATLDAGTNAITLGDDDPNETVEFGTLGLTAGNVDIDEDAGGSAQGTVFDDVAVNQLNVHSDGAITQTGGTTITVANTSDLVAIDESNNRYDITLVNAGNDFGNTVTSQGVNLSFDDDAGDFFIGDTIATGNLSVDTVGDINDSGVGVLDVDGTTLFNAGGFILVDSATNDFTGAVTATSVGDYDIADDNDLLMGTTIVGGNMTVEAGGTISDNGTTVDVAGDTILTATGDIVLDEVGNDFGSTAGNVTSSGVNITLSDDNDIELGDTTASGDLTVEAGAAGPGGITDTAGGTSISVLNGTAFLTATDSIILGDDGADNTNFGSIDVDSTNGDVAISEDSQMQIDNLNSGGNATMVANGDIDDTSGAAVTITGLASFDAAGGTANVTLGDNDGVDTTEFGSLSLTANTASVNEDAGGTQGTILDTVNVGTLNLQSDGAITDVAGSSISVAGVATLTAQDGGPTDYDITLGDNAIADTVNFGSLDAVGANVTVTEDSSTRIDGLLASGNTTFVANGNISDSTGAIIDVTGAASFDSTGGDTTLGDQGTDSTDFGSLSLYGASATVTEDSATILDEVAFDTGLSGSMSTLTLTSAGSITDSGAGSILASTANLFATQGGTFDITLGDTNTVDFDDLDAVGANITITDVDDLNLVAVDADGDLTLTTGGAVTDSGTVDVTGTTTVTATGFDITLDTATNDFDSDDTGDSVNTDGVNVTLVDQDSIDLGTTTATGNLDVTAGTDVTDTGTATVTGTTDVVAGGDIVLDTAANDFVGDVSTDATNTTLVDANAIQLADTFATGDLSVTASGGDLTDVSGVTIDVAGLGTLSAVGNSIVLGDDGADSTNFGSIDATATTVTITEDSAMDLAGLSATTATLTSAGDMTDSGTLTVSGTTTLDPGANSITFDEPTNDFGTVIVSNTLDLTLVDANDLILGTVFVGGHEDVTAGGLLTVQGTQDAGSADLTGADVDVNNTINTNTGDLAITATTTDIDVNASLVSLGALDLLAAGSVNVNATVGFVDPGTIEGTAGSVLIGSAVTTNTSLDVTAGTTLDVNAPVTAGTDVTMTSGDAMSLTDTVEGTAGSVILDSATSLVIDAGVTAGTFIDATAGTTLDSNAPLSAGTDVTLTSGDALTTTDTVDATAGSVSMDSATSATIGAAVTAGTSIDVLTGTTLDSNAALLAGTDVSLTSGDVMTTTATVDATAGSVSLDSATDASVGGAVTAGTNITATTVGQFDSTATMDAGEALSVDAGTDANIGAATTSGTTTDLVTGGNLTTTATVDAGTDLTTDSGGDTSIGAAISSGTDTDLDAAGTLTLGATLTAGAGATLDADGLTTVTDGSAIDAVDAVTFGADRAGSLDIAEGVTTAGGDVTFTNAVVLSDDLPVSTSGGAISFADTVDGAFDLDLTADTGNVSLLGDVTDITGFTIHSAGDVDLIGDMDTTGAVSVTSSGLFILDGDVAADGAVTQTGASQVRLGASILTAAQAVSFDSPVVVFANSVIDTTDGADPFLLGGADISFADTVDGAGITSLTENLVLNAGGGGALAFSEDVGSGAALGSLTVDAATISAPDVSITATNSIALDSGFLTVPDETFTSLNSDSIHLENAVTGQGNFSLASVGADIEVVDPDQASAGVLVVDPDKVNGFDGTLTIGADNRDGTTPLTPTSSSILVHDDLAADGRINIFAVDEVTMDGGDISAPVVVIGFSGPNGSLQNPDGFLGNTIFADHVALVSTDVIGAVPGEEVNVRPLNAAEGKLEILGNAARIYMNVNDMDIAKTRAEMQIAPVEEARLGQSGIRVRASVLSEAVLQILDRMNVPGDTPVYADPAFLQVLVDFLEAGGDIEDLMSGGEICLPADQGAEPVEEGSEKAADCRN